MSAHVQLQRLHAHMTLLWGGILRWAEQGLCVCRARFVHATSSCWNRKHGGGRGRQEDTDKVETSEGVTYGAQTLLLTSLWPLMGRGKAGCPGRISAAERGAHRQVPGAGGAAAEAGEPIQGLCVQPGEEVCAGQGQVGRLGTCWGPHSSLQLSQSLEGHHTLPRLSPKP